MKEDPGRLRLGILQLVIGATIISFSPVFVKIAHVPPTAAGFYRTLFGGVFLLLLVLARRESLWRGWQPFGLAIACAAFFALDLTFWHRSIEYVGPGLSTILGNFQVFFLAAFGIVVLKERVDARFIISVPLAIVGLALLVGVDWRALPPDYRMGVIFGLLTAVMYASYTLILRRSQAQSVRLSAVANLALISLGTALLMALETPLQRESFRIPDAQSWYAMIAYGVLCQALGWIFISRGLVKVEASRAGLILLLQPTLAFVWDVVMFGRPTGLLDLVGALLALGAIYIGGTRRR